MNYEGKKMKHFVACDIEKYFSFMLRIRTNDVPHINKEKKIVFI